MNPLRWKKLGHVFDPTNRSNWIQHTALTPTPLLLPDRIRVFVGLRDTEGISRVGYVDVDREDPTRVLEVSQVPSLDIGVPGTFDDNGVILGDLVFEGGELHLFYVGFQLVKRAKFIALSGHAVSRDHGLHFERSTKAPFLARADEGLFCRAIHSVQRTASGWNFLYSAGSDWLWNKGVAYPRYEIFSAEIPTLATPFPVRGKFEVGNTLPEYRIGRPRRFWFDGQEVMTFTAGTPHGSYLAGLAIRQSDGSWQRDDSLLGLQPSSEGWDSVHLCYPAFIDVGSRTFCFYNGNNMGREGFGVAERT